MHCSLGELRPEVLARTVPVIATFEQARYHFGDIGGLLDRIVKSAVALLLILVFGSFLGIIFRRILCLLCFLHPILGPWFEACRRNTRLRSFPYARFVRGRIVGIDGAQADEEVKLKVEGDGGRRILRVALVMPGSDMVRKTLGETVEFIVFSNDRSFQKINAHTDILAPKLKLFVGKYPYLRRNYFTKIRNRA